MIEGRRDLGAVLLEGALAGAAVAVPLAVWVLARSLPFNAGSGISLSIVTALLGAVYAGTGALAGAGLATVAHVLRAGTARGYAAAAIPLTTMLAVWVVRGRVRAAGPADGWALLAGLIVLLVAWGLSRVLRERGGRAAMLALIIAVVTAAMLLRNVGQAQSVKGDPAAREAVLAAPGPTRTVVVLGLDGVEPELLAELINRGQLPHLAALSQRSARSAMATLEPTWSPPIWTTFWTGKLPSQHGITYFVSEGTYRLGDTPIVVPRLLGAQAILGLLLPRVSVPVNQSQRRATAVWEVLGLAQLPSVAANRILSWPALPVRGAEFSERLLRLDPQIEGLTFPDSLAGPTLARLAAQTAIDDPGLEPAPWLALNLAQEAELWRIATEEAQRREAPLLLLYTHLIDSAQHRYLKYHWPERFSFRPDPAAVSRFGDVVAATYRAVDAQVGEVVASVPPDATILVVSDHGVRPNLELQADVPEPIGLTSMPPAEGKDVSGVHGEAPDGIFLLSGPGIPTGELDWKPHVLDVAPLLLDLLGLPSARDMVRLSPRRAHPDLATGPELEPVSSFEGWIPRRPGVISSAADQAILEELRALGYIE